jgi:hypothetical protein
MAHRCDRGRPFLAGTDANPPYERIDGMKPVNNRYNASVGPLMGMGTPAVISAVNIVVGGGQLR